MALISNLAKWRAQAVQAHCAESSARRRRTSRKFNIPTSGTRAVPTSRVSNDAAQLKFGDEELGSNQSVKRRPGRCSNPHSAPSACQNHGPSSGSPTSIWTRGTRGSSTLLERPKSVLPRHECSVSTFSTLSDVSALPVHRAFAASRFREAATGYGQPALCRRSDNGRSSWSRYRHSECAGPSRHSAGRAG